MQPLRKSIPRFAFMAVGIYLVCDALVPGPVCRWVLPRVMRTDADTVATVDQQKITRSEVDRALYQQLWLQGKSAADLEPAPLLAARTAALDELIDRALVRARVAAHGGNLQLTEAEIDARYNRFASRFASTSEMEASLKSQDLGSASDLRKRLVEQLLEEAFVASEIAPLIKVEDGEARAWYAAHADALAMPERIEVRHVFLATLDHPVDEAKAKLEQALVDLTTKRKDFAALATELSEDEASRNRGGSLGWMTRERLPVDFAEAVFAMPLAQPTLVRSRLGWHLVEVTARKAAEPRSFEQAKAEVIAALESSKRARAIAEFRANLRRSASTQIKIFEDRLNRQ